MLQKLNLSAVCVKLPSRKKGKDTLMSTIISPECKVLLSFSVEIYCVCYIRRLVSPRATEWRGGAALCCTVQLLTSD